MAVDYAAKHQEQGEKKWALRNAKLRFSRKLLYASGVAFCLSCKLKPPRTVEPRLFGSPVDESADPYIDSAMRFARTPCLEYLAEFIDEFVEDESKKRQIAGMIFNTYNEWLDILGDKTKREHLEGLSHSNAESDSTFQSVRLLSAEFAKGLELLFFGRHRESEVDSIAKLSLEYIGF